jgi:Predicted metal-dependent membrane protease
MGFFSHRKVERKFGFFDTDSWYTPGVSGLFAVLGWFLVGMIIASLVTMPMMLSGMELSYSMLIMYPLQFIAVMMFAKYQSSKNSTFERGYKLDSDHFGSKGGLFLGVLAAVATLAASLMLEVVNSILPEMTGELMKRMEELLNGPLWITLLSVSIFAPFFEEWMCRGIILRGLLNYVHKPTDLSDRPGRGMHPALAIAISALFFAAIHGNIWQGVTAFVIGSLFGYVYYRTGSLKLTMLMHCVNNTFSVLLSHFGSTELKDAKSLLDVMPLWEYAILFCISGVAVWFFISELKKVELHDKQGNCDMIPNAEDIYRSEKEAQGA